LISAVGDDDFGERILDYLELHRVSQRFIKICAGEYTDVTTILVNEQGEPAFVGWKGMITNRVDQTQVKGADIIIKEADIIFITFEVSIGVIEEAISIAKAGNTLVILNPAPPLDPLDPPPYNILSEVSMLIPNQWEAEKLLRVDRQSPEELAILLSQLNGKMTCITTAESGCVVVSDNQVKKYPTFFVGRPVDTTGGSDAFCVMLAIALVVYQLELDDAITLANAAAAIAIGRRGGSPSLPILREVIHLIKRRGINIRFRN
jgi:ribokinase